MKDTKADAVRQVLTEAGEHERFFDYSDVERLAWMIGRAYEIGRSAALMTGKRNYSQRRNSCLPKAQTSR